MIQQLILTWLSAISVVLAMLCISYIDRFYVDQPPSWPSQFRMDIDMATSTVNRDNDNNGIQFDSYGTIFYDGMNDRAAAFMSFDTDSSGGGVIPFKYVVLHDIAYEVDLTLGVCKKIPLDDANNWLRFPDGMKLEGKSFLRRGDLFHRFFHQLHTFSQNDHLIPLTQGLYIFTQH